MPASMLNLGAGGLVLSAAVFLCAGFARGYAGFGMSAVIMAALTLILPPAELVPIAIGLEIAASLGQARGVWREIDWRILGFLFAGALIGNPIGVHLLATLPPEPVKSALLAFILFASLLLWLSPGLALRLSGSLLAATGLVSGIVNGAAGVGGLVVALAFTAGRIPAPIMRAVFIAYLFAIDLWGSALLTLNGLFDVTALARIGFALPFMALGVWLGGRRFLSASPQSFRVFVLAMLVVLCAIGLIKLALV
ncbi:sulfite exporter TauE/SafE family protein [Aurantimonas sp. E1-2-R+4]|uniref:sulfite exporter TauE/SafE family protein n=1 Tax=Aurantimonas sp. E1-2-R+4 TaxID=3113714 RepID=UPI002F94871C